MGFCHPAPPYANIDDRGDSSTATAADFWGSLGMTLMGGFCLSSASDVLCLMSSVEWPCLSPVSSLLAVGKMHLYGSTVVISPGKFVLMWENLTGGLGVPPLSWRRPIGEVCGQFCPAGLASDRSCGGDTGTGNEAPPGMRVRGHS